MLSSEQREEFDRRGSLRLPGAVPAAAVTTMRDRFWDFLAAEHGLLRDRPDTWSVERPRHLQALRRSGAFAPMEADQVVGALDDLLGGPTGWRRPTFWGLPLVTFPGAGTWRVPTSGWHVDSYGPEYDLPGVTVFAFLAPVAGRGGGTVLIEGSHHLVNRHIAETGTWRPAEVRAAISAAHPWLREVWRGDRSPGDDAELAGARVAVGELTGEPGDVILMHPRTLHAAAPNAGPVPRLMLVEIVSR